MSLPSAKVTPTVQTLDTAYFSGKTPPFVLASGDNTNYILGQSVSFSGNYGGGELFKLVGNNVTFSKNGKSLTYNNIEVNQSTEKVGGYVHDSSNFVRAIPGYYIDNKASGSRVADGGATGQFTLYGA